MKPCAVQFLDYEPSKSPQNLNFLIVSVASKTTLWAQRPYFQLYAATDFEKLSVMSGEYGNLPAFSLLLSFPLFSPCEKSPSVILRPPKYPLSERYDGMLLDWAGPLKISMPNLPLVIPFFELSELHPVDSSRITDATTASTNFAIPEKLKKIKELAIKTDVVDASPYRFDFCRSWVSLNLPDSLLSTVLQEVITESQHRICRLSV